ncbi:GIDE domain-containing protein [Halostella litorea]|uniref:GIDE domain-containing protein n=1 Tax=Halostella litorea TaxID=2528831 RepID=UPI00109262A6|nr:GIDE domain-containing protein [Halostella litorea]
MVESLLSRVAISGVSMIFVVVGLYMLNTGRTARARSERIDDTETTAVRELQPGTAEVKGVARPAADGDVMESPITESEALATHVEMEEWESSGQGGGSWTTKHEDRAAVPMVVDDGTGEVRVDLPADGDLNVEKSRWKVGSGDEPPERIERYLEAESEIDTATRRDIGPLSIGERRRYSEGLIEPGEEVYVLGAAREEQSDWGERSYAIDATTDSGDFVLSDKSESELVNEGKRGGLVLLAFGVVFLLSGLFGTVIPWIGA